MIETSGLITNIWPYIQYILEEGNWDHPKIDLITDLALISDGLIADMHCTGNCPLIKPMRGS